MFETEKRFQACQTAGSGKLWLIRESKVAVDQSQPEFIGSDDGYATSLLCKVGVVLADIHRVIGFASQFFRSRPVLRIAGKPKTRRPIDDFPVEVEWVVEACLQTRRDRVNAIESLGEGQDNDKLVSAHACEQVD